MVSYNSFSNPQHYEMLRYRENQDLEMGEMLDNIIPTNSRCEAVLGNGNHSESYFENSPCLYCGVKPVITTPGQFTGEELWVPLAYEDAYHGFLRMEVITPINDRVRENYMLEEEVIAIAIYEDEDGSVHGETYTEKFLLNQMGIENSEEQK